MDSREPTNEIKDIIVSICGWKIFPEFKIEAMEYGDYFIDNNRTSAIFERKSYCDYLGSIDEHLKKRFIKMKQEADYQILILEGAPPNKINDRMFIDINGELRQSIRFNAYTNFMFSRGIDGIIIMPTINLRHTILMLDSIYWYLADFDSKRKIPKANDPLEMLQMFPKVGRKLSTKIKREYPNMIEALKDCENWMDAKTLEDYKRKW